MLLPPRNPAHVVHKNKSTHYTPSNVKKYACCCQKAKRQRPTKVINHVIHSFLPLDRQMIPPPKCPKRTTKTTTKTTKIKWAISFRQIICCHCCDCDWLYQITLNMSPLPDISPTTRDSAAAIMGCPSVVATTSHMAARNAVATDDGDCCALTNMVSWLLLFLLLLLLLWLLLLILLLLMLLLILLLFLLLSSQREAAKKDGRARRAVWMLDDDIVNGNVGSTKAWVVATERIAIHKSLIDIMMLLMMVTEWEEMSRSTENKWRGIQYSSNDDDDDRRVQWWESCWFWIFWCLTHDCGKSFGSRVSEILSWHQSRSRFENVS